MPGKPRRDAFWLDHTRKADQSGQKLSDYAKAAKTDVPTSEGQRT